MSRTFSSWARDRSAKGYARQTSSCSSPTSASSSAQIATMCCASTSSGLRGICVSSISPARIRCATTADSSRSARNFGKMRPRETSPREGPGGAARRRARGAADPRQAASDRLRRLDLDHEVDGAHVDPELERRRRDEARNPARFQVLLDLRPLLARQGAVVSARNLLLRALVQAEREPLGETTVVDEDDRRTVRADELDERRVDRGPDRARLVPFLAALPRLAHVLDGDDDLEVELLRDAGVDELDLASTRHEATDLLERTLGRREADPLHRLRRERLEPLDRQREMGAALRPGDCVHLVEDQRVDAAQQLPCARGEQQEERLRRRDQDVRRLAEHCRALLLRRVSRADGDPELGLETGERAAQVPLDVVVQRLERRDVEEPEACAGGLGEAVDSGENRRERLPGTGWRLDQDVAAGRDCRPALLLRRRRRSEVPLEPGTGLGTEELQRLHAPSLAPTSTAGTERFTVQAWSRVPLAARRTPRASASAGCAAPRSCRWPSPRARSGRS